MEPKKSKLIENALKRLPLDIKLMIIGPKGFLQKCAKCDRFDRHVRTIFVQSCENNCGILLCYYCKKDYVCPYWKHGKYKLNIIEYYIKQLQKKQRLHNLKKNYNFRNRPTNIRDKYTERWDKHVLRSCCHI